MIACALVAAVAFASATLFDAELAQLRGGILLPNGTNVAIGIALETRVNGVIAVRTLFSTEVPGVQVFAGGAATPTAGDPTPPTTGFSLPDIRIVRSGIGTTIGSAPAVGVSQVWLGSGQMAGSAGPALDLAGGRSARTGFGTVQALRTGTGTVVQLIGPYLSVQQSIGQAIGTVVANTGNDRIIDTTTAVSIDLRGMVIPAGMTSALEAVAIGVAARTH